MGASSHGASLQGEERGYALSVAAELRMVAACGAFFLRLPRHSMSPEFASTAPYPIRSISFGSLGKRWATADPASPPGSSTASPPLAKQNSADDPLPEYVTRLTTDTPLSAVLMPRRSAQTRAIVKSCG